MKNFKKLIKEAHLGNPLNEVDRATRVDRIFARDEEYPEFDPEDVLADLAREEDEEMNEDYDWLKNPTEKDKEYLRKKYESWNEMHPDDQVDIEKAMKGIYEMNNPETKESTYYKVAKFLRKELESEKNTDLGMILRAIEDKTTHMLSSDRQKMLQKLMVQVKKGEISKELKLGVKYELPTGETGYIMTGGSKDPKDWKFSGNKEPYLTVKDKLKATEKQPGKYDGVDFMDENMNDPVLMKTRAAQMKRDAMDKKDLENKSKRISADEAIDLRYELSILDKEREDILMRIEDIGVEMEQTAEPEGGPIADELSERLMTAEKELRAINNKIIDIKDDLGLFDMNESDLDEGTCGYTPDGEPRSKPAGPDLNEDEIPSYLTKNIIFGKAVEDSVSFNDFQKRVYGILGPKYYKLTDQGALKDFYDSIRGNKPKMESLNKSLKEALNKRLGK